MLILAGGRRPDQAAIARAIEPSPRVQVSLMPTAGSGLGSDWLELLSDGLTYDCLGLAPGPALAQPEWRHRLGLVGDDCALSGEAVGLFAGPHIEAAAHTLPVLRTQMMLACEIVAALPDVVAVGWTPAGVLMAPEPFVAAIEAWLDGKAFPALALVGFSTGAGGWLESDGLRFFTGQELRLSPEVADSPLAAVQLATRIIHELVAAQPLACEQAFTSPAGAALRLVPEDGGRIIAVARS